MWFDPWVGKIPWSRKQQPTAVFLSGEFHGQRGLVGYNPRSHSRTVQFSCSVVSNSWTAACQASLSITNSQSLLKLMSIVLVMPSNQLILCHPLLILPSIFPSITVFLNESVLHIRWLKYWSFNISPSSEYSGLISVKIDWFDLLAVQGTFKSLLQHHISKAILQHQLSLQSNYASIHDTGKTIALTRQTFVGKVMSLLFYVLLG